MSMADEHRREGPAAGQRRPAPATGSAGAAELPATPGKQHVPRSAVQPVARTPFSRPEA